MPKNIPVVFISSTSEDLRLYRAAARDASISAGFTPEMMEYFEASGANPPLEECLARVAKADVLVVLVAHRYGWVPPGQTKSITWLECGHTRKEVLAFLVDPKYDWPIEQKEEHKLLVAVAQGKLAEVAGEVQARVDSLGEFKAWLDSLGVRAAFTTPKTSAARSTKLLPNGASATPNSPRLLRSRPARAAIFSGSARRQPGSISAACRWAPAKRSASPFRTSTWSSPPPGRRTGPKPARVLPSPSRKR